ncbi:MAG: hypothetical protein IPG06_17220 [Haliea sp.]|nr:hypothetical protein [Haliea sp.]
MLETSQPWSLFGFDMRRALLYFRAGWRDFLWGDNSVVLEAVDEVVLAHYSDGEARYLGWETVEAPIAPGRDMAQAAVLPDRLVLSKTLRVPAAAEGDLESMLALEVASSSPFPKTDTCCGWSIANRQDDGFLVHLVISSKSAVMAYIADRISDQDVGTFEVWAQSEDRMVLVTGFGEAPRQQRNRRRLGRMVAIVAYCLLAGMLLFALAAGAKYLQLQKVRDTQERVERSAKDAVELRTALASSKAIITAVNSLLAEHPSPYKELVRLTALLGDDTWLGMFEMQGMNIKIEGESSDASAVMQQLLDNSAYVLVEAPVAIRSVAPGRERFVLNLTLASGDGSE